MRFVGVNLLRNFSSLVILRFFSSAFPSYMLTNVGFKETFLKEAKVFEEPAGNHKKELASLAVVTFSCRYVSHSFRTMLSYFYFDIQILYFLKKKQFIKRNNN